MFAANLLYYVGGRCHELCPSSQSVDIKLLSSRGEGKCVLHVDVSQKETKELLVYIPSYLRYESVVYNCRVSNVTVNSSACGEHKATEVILRDREALKGKAANKQRTFSKVKSHFKQLVCTKNNAITTSSEDFIFSVQDIPSQSVLSIEVQFLLELKPSYYGSDNCIAVSCHWNKKTSYSYSLDYVSPYAVDTVKPSDEDQGSFKWHVYGTDRNFARVSFKSSSESATQLEFQIVSNHAYSPSLLVASSKSPLHQNGSSSSEHYVLLDLLFASTLHSRVAKAKFPSEFIFLVDCSGSMCGANIQSATDALILFIKSLPVTCYFNVIAFGSTFRNLFEVSQEYSMETVEKALLFADKLQASLGGTELLNPLHWVLKKPLIGNMPRQVFILTDGAVTNTKAVLREIQKYSHQTRCHTFGIGSEACHELVLGVAALSNGRHVLVGNKDRLQEKVINTLEESLKPALTDVNVAWHPPINYNVVETLHGHTGTVFSGGSASYWGEVIGNGHPSSPSDPDAFAVVTGTLGGVHKFEQVIRDVCDVNVTIPYYTVEKLVAWVKIQELEKKLAVSRRRSQDEQFFAEEDKTQTNYTTQQLSELSSKFHIPCSLNCLVGKESSLLSVQQIIPEGIYNQTKPVVNSTKPVSYRHYRSRNGSSKLHHMSDRPSFLPASNSLGMMVKGAVCSVSNSLKSLISVGLDSVFGPGYQDFVEDGQLIDDEIKLQDSSSMLRWGPEGELLHPSFYYQSKSSIQKCDDTVSGDIVRKRKSSQTPVVVKSLKLDDANTNTDQLASMSLSDDPCDTTQESVTVDCRQMDVTHQPPVTGPAGMMPLIHMQSYDGPWQLTELFVSAIGIPYRQVKEFIQAQLPHSNGKSPIHCNKNGYLSTDHEKYWATVLAIVCLQVHFSSYQAEWKLLAEKATEWLDQVNSILSISSSHAIENASNFTQQITV